MLISIQAERASNLANRTARATPFLRRRRPKHGKIVSRNAISHLALRDNATINLFVGGRDRHLPPAALLRRSLPLAQQGGNIGTLHRSFSGCELQIAFPPSFLLLLIALLLRRRRRCHLRGSIDGGARGLLGGVDLIVLLDGALVEPDGTELLVLRQEVVRLLILVAAERRRRLRRGIIGDGVRGTRRHWLTEIQIKLYSSRPPNNRCNGGISPGGCSSRPPHPFTPLLVTVY